MCLDIPSSAAIESMKCDLKKQRHVQTSGLGNCYVPTISKLFKVGVASEAPPPLGTNVTEGYCCYRDNIDKLYTLV